MRIVVRDIKQLVALLFFAICGYWYLASKISCKNFLALL